MAAALGTSRPWRRRRMAITCVVGLIVGVFVDGVKKRDADAWVNPSGRPALKANRRKSLLPCREAPEGSEELEILMRPVYAAEKLPKPYPGMTNISDNDARVLEERHFFREKGAGLRWDLRDKTIGAGRRCRHGVPQALLYDPVWNQGRLGDTTRLTCPLLVAAIDAYEKQGAIPRYNKRLKDDETWKGQLLETNRAHRDLRKLLIGDRDDEMASVRKRMGDKTVGLILETAGLAGMRLDSEDVKCLHAQVGDELVRDGHNIIAKQVLEDLEAQGVDTMGTDCCCDHCDFNIPLEESRWNFKGAKNQLGQRMRKLKKEDKSISYKQTSMSSR